MTDLDCSGGGDQLIRTALIHCFFWIIIAAEMCTGVCPSKDVIPIVHLVIDLIEGHPVFYFAFVMFKAYLGKLDEEVNCLTVHANEFIANHQATGNPNLLPILRLIDHAQKNNTVGSLTAQDVSNAIGGGTSPSANTGNSTADTINVNFDAVAASLQHNAKVIEKLQQQLEGGIESYVTIDGEHGFERQYNHYKKLQSNKSR